MSCQTLFNKCICHQKSTNHKNSLTAKYLRVNNAVIGIGTSEASLFNKSVIIRNSANR